MKKKLIAAILSVAMVASMVPATAFAATGGAASAKTVATKQLAGAKEVNVKSVAIDNTGQWGDKNPTVKANDLVASADGKTFTCKLTGTVPYDVSGKVKPALTATLSSWFATAKNYVVDDGELTSGTPVATPFKISTWEIDKTAEASKTKTFKFTGTNDSNEAVAGEVYTLKIDATALEFQTEAETKVLQSVEFAAQKLTVNNDPTDGSEKYKDFLTSSEMTYKDADFTKDPMENFSLTAVMVANKIIPANGKLELVVKVPTTVATSSGVDVTVATGSASGGALGWSVGDNDLTTATTDQKVIITNKTEQIPLTIEGYKPIKIDVKGLMFQAGNTDFDSLVEKINKEFDNAISPVTYSKFAEYDKIYKQVSQLSAADLDKLVEQTGGDASSSGNYEKNFKDAYNETVRLKGIVDRAKTAINQIPTGALTANNKGTVNAATNAIKAVRDLESPNKLGTTASGTVLTTEDVIGKTDMTTYTNATIIMTAVNAIDNMLPVNSTTYNGYEKKDETVAATEAIIAAKVAGVEARIGNMTDYTQKIKAANNADSLLATADAAVAAAKTYANGLKAPYTQTQLDKLTSLKNTAITAVKASTITVSSAATVIGTAGTKPPFSTGSVNDKIKEIEDSMKNEKAVGPVVKMVGKMPSASALTWANKDDMFNLSYAYAELSDDEKIYFAAEYPVEVAKLQALETAQADVENRNLQAAIDRMTTQINAMPAATLDNEEAINKVAAAYTQYETGNLNGVPVITNLTSAVKTKYESTVSSLKSLTDARDKQDKVVVKKFTDLMASLNAKGGIALSDKVLIQEARAEYDKLTASQKKLVKDDFEALEAMEKIIKELEEGIDVDALANQVIVAVRALTAADKITIADRDAVYAANDLYLSALAKDSGVKDKVTNLTDLYTAVGKVMDLEIAALPTLKADGTDTAEEIAAAAEKTKAVKATYDKIGKEQQTYVSKSADLDKAVATLSTINVAHINAQLKIIAAFDYEKELTAENIALIKEEKACIDALTDDEKAKLTAADYEIFKTKALPALEKAQEAETSLEAASVVAANVVYNAKAQTPEVKVTDKAGNVVDPKNYKVVYSDNKEVGKATVTVTSLTGGAYTGAATGTFLITPAKDKVNSLQVSKAVLRVNMEAMPGANHQIWYKLTSKDDYSRINTSSNSKRLTSKEGIKAKKKYTVKAKAYLKDDGKVYYGSFSSLKRATTK